MLIYELKRGDRFKVVEDDAPYILYRDLIFRRMDGMYAQAEFAEHTVETQEWIDQNYCEGSEFFCLLCGTEVEKL